jgi:hypothetical protein
MCCTTCNGKGLIVLEEPIYFGNDGYYLFGEFECGDCHGEGEVFDEA